MQPTRHIPGLEICEIFFVYSVKPILDRYFPSLKYSAALVGEGSEVLGFDTAMSCDHDWGPRVKIFLTEEDQVKLSVAISQKLREELPVKQGVYSTNFVQVNEKTTVMEVGERGNVNHRVEFSTMAGFIDEYLSFDITSEITASDWLTFSEQKLATIVGGKVFHDDLDLEALRRRFAYYPKDVWLYLMACGWTRIEQEQHLMCRAGSVGDELGSAIIASRLARDVMRLAFLVESTYAPYAKWFGTAFAKLQLAAELSAALREVVFADSWKKREKHLVAAYLSLATAHNKLNVSDPIPSMASEFFDRPFMVISCGEASSAIKAAIQDPEVRKIAENGLIGSVDLLSDNTDLISHPEWRKKLKSLYE